MGQSDLTSVVEMANEVYENINKRETVKGLAFWNTTVPSSGWQAGSLEATMHNAILNV